jgi:hypothetical protein
MTGFPPTTATEGRLTVRFYGDPAPPPPRELIKGLLPAEGLAFLGGQSSAGKTFILILLAIVLAALEPGLFFGRRRKERVGVLIVAAEGHSTLEARLRAATKHLGIEGPLPIGIISFDGDLSTDGGNAELAALILETGGRMQREYNVRLGLIAIDTMGAAYVLSDEDSNAEANQIVRKARALATGAGALVLLVHHYGKTAGSGLRGASAYRASADAVLAVTADRNELQFLVKNRQLGLSKSRTGEEGPIGGFKLVQVDLGVDEDGDRIASCSVLPSEGAVGGDGRVAGTRGPTLLLDALDAALEAHGEAHPGAPPALRGVKLDHVRAVFSARYPVRGKTEQRKPDTVRRAFKRALDDHDDRVVRHRDEHGEWLWRSP